MQPVDKREFHAFISYRHFDQDFVNKLDTWLTEDAGLKIWLDRRNLPPGAKIVSYLPTAIENSRAIILILSKKATESGWVKEEYDFAIYYYQIVLKIIPDHTLALINLGYSFEKINSIIKGYHCYKTALFWDPLNKLAYTRFLTVEKKIKNIV